MPTLPANSGIEGIRSRETAKSQKLEPRKAPICSPCNPRGGGDPKSRKREVATSTRAPQPSNLQSVLSLGIGERALT
eukprot:7559660-Alexandrium_andersonii.AAC.1